ncbi:MAG: PAS domain S-box protein [Bacteriovoracaceae bacterium]|nr:PAS domain S-box protein [Bacteriovoracaceae bacterium]
METEVNNSSLVLSILENCSHSELKGKEWLKLVNNLITSSFPIDYSFIGEMIDDSSVNTISISNNGKPIDNFSYDLVDTPCSVVFDLGVCEYLGNVCEKFPKDQLLIDMGIKSYIGTPLISQKNSVRGIFVFLSSETLAIEESVMLKQLMYLLRGRIESEIDKIRVINELSQYESKYGTLFETLQDILIVIKPNGTIESINPHGASELGYAVEELVGQNINIIMPSPYREEHDSYLEKYMKTGISRIIGQPREIPIVKKSGEEFPGYLRINKIESNNELRFMGLIVNLTETKDQQKLVMINSKLATLGELTSNIGHEINNPLTIVKGMIEILKIKNKKGELDTDELLRVLGNQEIAVSRMSDIVRGLKVYARSSEYDLEKHSVETIADQTLLLLREIYSKENIQLIESFPSKLNYIKVNFGQVQQVLMNLLANARDEIKDQMEKKISIKSWSSRTRVFLSIEDNGSGVEEKNKSRVFDSFFTTKPVGVGTGIGLSICKSIIENFEGTIDLNQSEELGGACFTISFPKERS